MCRACLRSQKRRNTALTLAHAQTMSRPQFALLIEKIVDASRWCTFHCNITNNRLFFYSFWPNPFSHLAAFTYNSLYTIPPRRLFLLFLVKLGPAHTIQETRPSRRAVGRRLRLGLYTILASPISYGVWHAQGGSEEASYIAQETWTSIAIVRAMQVEGAYKRMIDSCTQASK